MNNALAIVDQRGNPIMASAYRAAGHDAAELAGWYPPTVSGDGEWLPDMNLLRARVHDYVRNNGMVSGAIQTHIDNWIGAGLRLTAKPDWQVLGVTDLDYAAEWEDRSEAKFRQWANDIDCYCDASRQLSFGGMVAQACRTYLISFEILASAEWLRRPGAKYRTALQMIDPIRLSNPHDKPDSDRLRAGVQFDPIGAPEGYYIASRVPGDPNDPVLKYLQERVGFHKGSTIRFGDNSLISHLYPGEEIKHLTPGHPAANFDTFERVFHRYQAAGMNMTYEQYTRDYSQTNYSGHRAALLDYWRFVTGRRSNTAGKFASYGYALWLEEAMDSGEVETPPGAPSYLEEKTAWTRCDWIGPGRGQIDPLKEANAARVEDDSGWTTAEKECAERGLDWREVYLQRAQEAKYRGQLAQKFGIEVADIRGGGPTPVAQPPDVPEEARGNQQQGGAA